MGVSLTLLDGGRKVGRRRRVSVARRPPVMRADSGIALLSRLETLGEHVARTSVATACGNLMPTGSATAAAWQTVGRMGGTGIALLVVLAVNEGAVNAMDVRIARVIGGVQYEGALTTITATLGAVLSGPGGADELLIQVRHPVAATTYRLGYIITGGT